MSDSDEDIMAESVHRLRHNIMNLGASNMNNTNITSFSFKNNTMTSTFKSNFKRQVNSLQSTHQERDIYYRRETSPMSLKSFRDSRPQTFRNHPGGMSSHRSVYNGRGGSPMSMRSIGSNVSVSAVDIAQAFKYENFNKYDLRLIKEAYNKFMKKRTRKRIEKRKNLKLFLKGYRRKPGDDDSGEQGSDSSISSDDCKSTRSYNYNKRSGPRSTKTDITHFRSSIRDCDMYRDCTDSLKQTRLQNIFTPNNTSIIHEEVNSTINQKQKLNSNSVQKITPPNIPNATLKDRFTKGTNSFLLPSQRFNKSVVNLNNTESCHNQRKNVQNSNNNNNRNLVNIDTDSEKEEIFSEITVRENLQNSQQKRALEDSEAMSSEKKRYKAATPTKQNDFSDVTQSDFNFKKPQMPVRKSANNRRDPVPERIIAMSKPLPDNLVLDIPKKTIDNLEITRNKLPVNSTEIEECSNQTEITQNTTDVSMRPSFIKRKLFTQKLDVAENNNLSSDNVGANSPQGNLYSGAREKNKVRKLVTSQSCLSRDVLCDDNMLDLIHKIVPPDQINVTTTANKKEIDKTNENDKWDVTSVISTCNIGDVSDTFTDEEIFKAPSNLQKGTKKSHTAVESVKETVNLNKNEMPKIMTPCKVVVQKIPVANLKINQKEIEANKSNYTNKKTVSSCIKSFWDTDFESDMEERNVTPWKSRKIIDKEIEKDTICNNSKKNSTRGTILTIRSLQNKTINSSMRSDISRVSKKTTNKENKENNTISKNLEINKEIQNNKKLNKDPINKKPKAKENESSKPEQVNSKSKSVQTKNKVTNSKTTKKESTCNTSRESLRLKEKKEKSDMEKRSRGRPRISKENEDPVKLNNRNSKETPSRNNKSNNKTNNNNVKNNNNMKTNNNKTNINSIKKNNKINQTKLQTPQKKQAKNLFATPVTDSSFNISNRSLRIRHRTFKQC